MHPQSCMSRYDAGVTCDLCRCVCVGGGGGGGASGGHAYVDACRDEM